VFENLIESKQKGTRTLGQTALSVLVHGGIIFAAVRATQGVAETMKNRPIDTTMVFLKPPPPPPPPPNQPPPDVIVAANPPPKGFQTVVAPDVIPTNIPPVNLQEHFDPKDYSGTGVEGGISTGMVPTGNEVFMEAIVEEKPSVLSGPQPQYPELLRQAGIQGRVMVQAIIDTTGRAEPASLKIIASPNPGFDQSAKNYVLKALFRPARVHGRAVRVLINIPIDFKITGR